MADPASGANIADLSITGDENEALLCAIKRLNGAEAALFRRENPAFDATKTEESTDLNDGATLFKPETVAAEPPENVSVSVTSGEPTTSQMPETILYEEQSPAKTKTSKNLCHKQNDNATKSTTQGFLLPGKF